MASVELPYTIRLPDAETLPVGDAVNAVFCVHAIPFQYKEELVAVPSANAPDTTDQNVDVPVVVRNWPGVPGFPLESLSSPVTRKLAIVAVAKSERPLLVIS